ncbi:MAG: hypothetical protein JWO71_665 [Candidatus Acidoferrum typicum]|nr:hypothetical protein [Candidatus Acidoferrum typicum]
MREDAGSATSVTEIFKCFQMGTATVAKADEITVSAVNAEAPRFRREKTAALLNHLGATNFGFGGRETLCTGGGLLLARAYCFGREGQDGELSTAAVSFRSSTRTDRKPGGEQQADFGLEESLNLQHILRKTEFRFFTILYNVHNVHDVHGAQLARQSGPFATSSGPSPKLINKTGSFLGPCQRHTSHNPDRVAGAAGSIHCPTHDGQPNHECASASLDSSRPTSLGLFAFAW